MNNLGSVTVHEGGGGKKRGKKGKKHVIVASAAEPKEPQMPTAEKDFPSLDDA